MKVVKIVGIVLLLLVILGLIGLVGFGYYKKATLNTAELSSPDCQERSRERLARKELLKA